MMQEDIVSYISNELDGIRKWYLKTKDNDYDSILKYNGIFSTTYYIDELYGYLLCPKCLSAFPEVWKNCLVCS
jgi:hypothetical protein